MSASLERRTPHDPRAVRGGRDSGAQAAVLGCALVLTAVALDLMLTDRLTIFFDLSFVTACLAVAWMVRLDDFYAVTILPPFLMLSICVLVDFAAPGAIGRHDDGLVQAVISGLSAHSFALVSGYVVALACLFARLRDERRTVRRSVADQVGF